MRVVELGALQAHRPRLLIHLLKETPDPSLLRIRGPSLPGEQEPSEELGKQESDVICGGQHHRKEQVVAG